MNAPTGTLDRRLPPAQPMLRSVLKPTLKPMFWFALALATVLGAALLAAFVATLQQGVRRGEEFRQWQRAGITRKAFSSVASALPGAQTQPAGATLPANFH